MAYHMEKNFWRALPKPFFVLAPMAEVTDVAFRRIVAECGRPDVFYTEFISADGLASAKGRPRLMQDLRFDERERPIVAQFFGARPEHIREAARTARELGFDGVDINMGCPDRKVMKQGGGAALCGDPSLANAIIAAAKEGAGTLPVSVKSRLGIARPEEFREWLGAILEVGIAALAVHLRTAKEMSKVPAHWEVMPEIVEMAHAAGALAIGNGDVMSVEEGEAFARNTGADGIMVGRGVFHNPWFWNRGKNPREASPRERIELLLRHTRYFLDAWGASRNFNILKRFYKIYISGFDGAHELRDVLMKARDEAEVRVACYNYLTTHVVAHAPAFGN